MVDPSARGFLSDPVRTRWQVQRLSFFVALYRFSSYFPALAFNLLVSVYLDLVRLRLPSTCYLCRQLLRPTAV